MDRIDTNRFLSILLTALGLPGVDDYNPLGTLNKLSYYSTQTGIFAALWFTCSGFIRRAERENRLCVWIASFPGS